jgi:hypothetical protein
MTQGILFGRVIALCPALGAGGEFLNRRSEVRALSGPPIISRSYALLPLMHPDRKCLGQHAGQHFATFDARTVNARSL